MKHFMFSSTLILLCVISLSCAKTSEPAKTSATASPAPAASATPAPEKKQEYKGISIVVHDVVREANHKEIDQTVEPSKPGNDFAVVQLALKPLKDATIVLQDGPAGSSVFTTTDGKVTLKEPYVAFDEQGKKHNGMSISFAPGGGPSKDFAVIYVFELPKSAQLRTLQFEDIQLLLEKVAGR